jgi:hypothetical protein
MTVDFPDPEGPTRAVVLPASNVHEKSLRTCKSYLVGYVKFTLSKTMFPFISEITTLFFGSLGSTLGFFSIILRARRAATLAYCIAVKAGPPAPNCIAPKTIQNMIPTTCPP